LFFLLKDVAATFALGFAYGARHSRTGLLLAPMGLLSEILKYAYILALPRLDFQEVYGPFALSVSLMFWAFLSGLLLLTGAHLSAQRHVRI
jgi:uncharacterized BrkB/YihY/UPF0761 family membrane protein